MVYILCDLDEEKSYTMGKISGEHNANEVCFSYIKKQYMEG
jgi:hypothetical protein